MSWLSLLLVVLICLDVLFRYVFNSTQTWIIELEWHIFSIIFLLSAASTLNSDEHVRVDLFYNKYSKKQKLWFDLLLMFFLVLPWCAVIIKTSFNYGLNSFYMREASPNPGGLAARYLIKFSITLGFVLLFFQAIAKILANAYLLLKREY